MNFPKLIIPALPLPYFLECGETYYHAGDQHPNRSHLDFFDLILVESGRLYIGEEDQQWTVKAGETILLLPHRRHYAVKPCTEDTHFFWLHFQIKGSWEELEKEKKEYSLHNIASTYTIKISKYGLQHNPDHIYNYFKKLIQSSLESRSQAFWQQQYVFHELLKIMDEGQQASDHSSPSLLVTEKTEQFIKQNYQRNITNAVLSNELHYHYNYITRCMKKELGLSPMEYLMQYRLEQAKLLLIKTEWPIAMIADQSGFGHPAYFSRCFSVKFGAAPLKFRKNFSR